MNTEDSANRSARISPPDPASSRLPDAAREEDDSIERLGKRIARALAAVAAVGLLAYLIIAYGLR